jgi:hypothetical protein
MAHSKDGPGYFMLNTLYLQCYLDLYRFLVPGVLESISTEAFSNTPAQYIGYCQERCLHYAIELCNFWSAFYAVNKFLKVRQMIYAAMLYQVVQILVNLRDRFASAPEPLYDLHDKLEQAYNMAHLPSISRNPLLAELLRETATLISSLCDPMPAVKPSTPSHNDGRGKRHMMSRGHPLPRLDSSESDEATGPSSRPATNQRTPIIVDLQQDRESHGPEYTTRFLTAQGSGRASPNGTFSNAQQLQFPIDMPWVPFDLDIYGDYDPELGALGMHYQC